MCILKAAREIIKGSIESENTALTASSLCPPQVLGLELLPPFPP